MYNFSQRALREVNNPLQALFDKTKGMTDVIFLSIGDPDVDTPLLAKKKAVEAIWDNKTKYVSASGSFDLRVAITAKYRSAGCDVIPEEVLVSHGSRVILSAVLWAFVSPKDNILILAPYYPSFVSIVEDYGGNVHLLDTVVNDFKVTAEMVEECLHQYGRIKVLIINSPNNPTGVCYDHGELEKIVALSHQYDFVIISDECYQRFSTEPDFTMRTLDSDIIVTNSVSKEYSMTGWRIGWGIMPERIARIVKCFLCTHISSICSVSEQVAIQALRGEAIGDFVEQRRYMYSWLSENNIPCVVSDAGFYVFPDFSRYFVCNINDSSALAEYLLKVARVAVAPGVAFGPGYGKYLRISYAVNMDTLIVALAKMKKALDGLLCNS